ncbi:CinA family protein [Aestuariibacter sp. A3R04]|uniref:CinA family protein n=1 Tax=Aestuariibacter sp. A3R04 TaxID=2841571 RepID=UPI001C08510E|nr:CinA family protein [Aestuariibacter sp. A3R04]MBU3022075.1 CinA family protein [Aestuariibacter sp. A3R04]
MNEDISTVSGDGLLQAQILALGEALRQHRATVSCAESCTGGGIAFAFTSVAGSSDWFNQSWVTYSNEAKQTQLGVKASTLAAYGAVSEQTVREMVAGVTTRSGAQIGISVSGIAGPGGGSQEKPVGTVWFGFAVFSETLAIKRVFDGDRCAVRHQAISFAIDFLYQRLVAHQA